MEVLLRIIAMLIDGENYAPSMKKFLNHFSHKCKSWEADKNKYIEDLFDSFLAAAKGLSKNTFLNKQNKRFNIALIEAVFTASCSKAFEEGRLVTGKLDAKMIKELEKDPKFVESSSRATTQKSNVMARLERGKSFIEQL